MKYILKQAELRRANAEAAEMEREAGSDDDDETMNVDE